MSAKYQGSCLCGAVSYQSEAEPRYSFNCHCRDCQKATTTRRAKRSFNSSARRSQSLKIFQLTTYFQFRLVGSAYAPIAFFHQSELKVSGELKYFETLGSSGRAML
jgi:hypothetical protein